MGDIGINTTMKIIEDLKIKVKENSIKEKKECKDLLINSIKKQMTFSDDAYDFENEKSVVLVIGVVTLFLSERNILRPVMFCEFNKYSPLE